MVFNIGDKVRVKDDDSGETWIVFSVFRELNEVLILGFEKNETCHRLVNPSEIILVDQNADLKQAIREVLLSEEFLSAFAKAFANTPIPSTIQYVSDLSKGLVKAWTCENGKAKQVYPEQPQPPDGYRWLEIGEVIRKGDRCLTYHGGLIDCLTSIGEKFNHEAHYPTIRRNRFEVGEKVVRVSNGAVYKVIRILSMGYQLESEFCAEVILYAKDLAPYIEETT